mmetsp:Transcript_24773/g.45418  ORF Transcript_24773/g.45418 Transcript_24773/m.45418 type:complete len:294 (+) Transcript_24773:867-1748(+)
MEHLLPLGVEVSLQGNRTSCSKSGLCLREPHSFGFGVLFQIIWAQISCAPKPRVAEPSKRGIANELAMRVDPHCASLQLVAQLASHLQVFAPNRSAQTIWSGIGSFHSFRISLERHDWKHRAKLLFIHKSNTLLYTNNNGWQVEEACALPFISRGSCNSTTATKNLATKSTSIFQQRFYVLQLCIAGQWAKFNILYKTVANGCPPSTGCQSLAKAIKDVLMDIQTLDGHTSLTIVEECCLEHALSSCRDVNILTNNGCIISTKFKQEALEVTGTSLHHLPSHQRGACENDLPH